jgi:cell division protein FtsB
MRRTGFSTDPKLNRLIQSGTHWVYLSRRKLATAAMGALLCLIGYHVVFGANGFLVFHQKKAESQKLEQEIQALQEESARTQQQIKSLKSDPQAIEKEARERLHYARPGEMVYKLPSATPTPANEK